MVKYIQRKDSNGVETVDEFPYNNKTERLYVKQMLKEYRMSDRYANYYLSQRCTSCWKGATVNVEQFCKQENKNIFERHLQAHEQSQTDNFIPLDYGID